MLSQKMAQRIEHRKLAELTPYRNNPNHRPDAQIAQIAGSIAHWTSGSLSHALLASAAGTLAEGQKAN
jgi:hypothetical protein